MQSMHELLIDIEREFPDFRVQFKSTSPLMRCIAWALKLITFGRMTSFMTSFVTTFGHTVYVPSKWGVWPERNKIAVLRHERVHMRQQARYGRLWFSLLYLLAAPCLFAFYRTKFEQEAYEESLRALLEFYGPEQIRNGETREQIVSTFTGPDYFWMWVRRADIERWYDQTVERLIREQSYS